MRYLLLVALILSPSVLCAATKGNLENPQPDDYASGIYLISGWVCEAERVEILLDGAQYVEAAYGTERLDTLSPCGDTDNGFGLLFNMANLESGEHQVTLLADGHVIDTHDFKTPGLSTGEFATGLNGCAISEGFPSDGTETYLQWTESSQGFQIVEEAASLKYALEGVWLAEGVQASIWVNRRACGDLNLFLHADLENDLGEADILKMVGPVTGDSFQVTSTDDDGADREAIITISSSEEILLQFTECGPALAISCEWTPVNGRINLVKVKNPMDLEHAPTTN